MGGCGEGVGMRGTWGGHYPHLSPLLSAGAVIFLIPRKPPYWIRVSLASFWTSLGSIWGGKAGGCHLWMAGIPLGRLLEKAGSKLVGGFGYYCLCIGAWPLTAFG